jgi:hypothetical protein
MGANPNGYWLTRKFWVVVIFPVIGALLLAGVGILKGWLHRRVGFDSDGKQLTSTPSASEPANPRELLGSVVIYRNILEDLRRRDEESRPRLRYLTLLHRYNEPGYSEADLNADRLAVRDLAASLCRKRSPRLEFIDPNQLVFRIDLEDLDWDPANEWHQVISNYRYGLGAEGNDPEAKLRRQVEELTEDLVPVVRADWFVAELTHPPLSAPDGLLRVTNGGLPESVRALSRRYSAKTLNLAVCARELGLADSTSLSSLIQQNDHLKREFGLAPLLKGESIQREWWESDRNLTSPYQELARLLKLGIPVRVQ